ncbi:hypothetical protein H0H92_001195 [Tricholoma furcatifolium]|nr:hypothetical protein H0H92_001195 [Tricholoma furcatifolium]
MILKSVLLLLYATASLSSPLELPSALEKRDDYFPARVPYVFPPPGTDPIADAIRARRENGTLLALDSVL